MCFLMIKQKLQNFLVILSKTKVGKMWENKKIKAKSFFIISLALGFWLLLLDSNQRPIG